MKDEKNAKGLSGCYIQYCKGGECWGELWGLVSEYAKKSLSRLIRKTGARLTEEDRFDIHNLIVCRVLERLKEKKRIGRIGGVIYWATSDELSRRKTLFKHDGANIELCEDTQEDAEQGHDYDVSLSDGVRSYQCERLGCANMLAAPGYCREHSRGIDAPGAILSPKTMLTVERVAIELGLSSRAVWEKLREKEIPSEIEHGRRVVRYCSVILYKQQTLALNENKLTSQVKTPLFASR